MSVTSSVGVSLMCGKEMQMLVYTKGHKVLEQLSGSCRWIQVRRGGSIGRRLDKGQRWKDINCEMRRFGEKRREI